MDHGEITISSIPRTPQHNFPAAITQQYLIYYLGMDPNHKIAHLWKKRMNRHAKEAYPIRKTTLAIELAQQMEKLKAKLPQPYANFRDIFEKKTINELPPSRTFDHTIELNEGFSPKVAKVYPLNPKEQEACRTFVDEHLKLGKIVPSKSPQALPFFLVSKKDGSVRPCQDYWYLNSILSRVPTCYHLSPTWLTNSKGHWSSPKWISNGDTTMSSLNQKIDGKQHSSPPGTIQTNNNVLWPMQLSCHLSGIDKPYLWWSYSREMAHCLHGWHPYPLQ